MKNWCFEQWCWRRFLRVPWTARRLNQSILKEIKQVHPKGNQPWIFIARTDLKLKLQYFGHLMWRTDSLEKTLMLGKIEGRRRGREDKTVGWHHWFNGREFKQTPGYYEGQWSLACCSPWGHKELDMTEWPNNKWLSERSFVWVKVGSLGYSILCSQDLNMVWHFVEMAH